MQVNQLRSLLYEFGISVKDGRQAGLAEIRQRMSELDESVPGLLMSALQDSLQRLSLLDEDIRKIERRIAAWMKEQAACRAIAEIPGVGTLAATALVATIGLAHNFKSGREFASFVGLVPRQTGTGGKVRLGRISKRGDYFLRTLLIHGARSVLFTARDKSAWVESSVKRRPTNVVAIALANKIFRTA